MNKNSKMLFGAVMALIILILSVGLKIYSDRIKEKNYREKTYTVETKEDVRSFIISCGYECEEITTANEKIPSIFNEVYSEYNEVQKAQGFDLSKYKGQKVLIYKGILKNSEKGSYITIIVFENLIKVE